MERVRWRSAPVACSAVLVALALLGTAPLGAAGSASAAPGVPCAPRVRVCIELAAGRAWLLDVQGGVMRGPMAITSGAEGMATPIGRFSVQWKDADHVSSFGGAAMPWSVFFDRRGRALHGGSLQRQSRGCVHLADEDARTIFNEVAPGAGIEILP